VYNKELVPEKEFILLSKGNIFFLNTKFHCVFNLNFELETVKLLLLFKEILFLIFEIKKLFNSSTRFFAIKLEKIKLFFSFNLNNKKIIFLDKNLKNIDLYLILPKFFCFKFELILIKEL